MRRKIAAGNWKMNGNQSHLVQLVSLAAQHPAPKVDVVICPPTTLITRAYQRIYDTPLSLGAQDCHAAAKGAHTGDVSAKMLTDAGAEYVLVGHSERRADHNETSSAVCAKAQAALDAGLVAIICIGETLDQRQAGNTLQVVAKELRQSVPETATGKNVVIAYEPVWAIGTGKVATTEQIGEVHGFLRTQLQDRFGNQRGTDFRLLYGGSVKAVNATKIFAVNNVDGALVGGASLKSEDFSPIITALEAS